MTLFQPAPGIWRSSPARILLWACEQVRVVKTDQDEQPKVDGWTKKLAKVLNQPVKDYDWQAYYEQVTKADEEIPAEVSGAWADLEASLAALWVEGADMRTSGIGLDFDPADMAAAVGNVGDLVKTLGDNAAERLRFLIVETLAKEGVSQFAFAKTIRDEWAGTAKTSAERIAVTEWNRAASGATLHSYRKQGIKSKVWFTVAGACPVCTENAGAGEVPIDDVFPSGVDHPPAHPWCRCNVSAGYSQSDS